MCLDSDIDLFADQEAVTNQVLVVSAFRKAKRIISQTFQAQLPQENLDHILHHSTPLFLNLT